MEQRQMNIKSRAARVFVAKQIAKMRNRGFATRDKVRVVLNRLRRMGLKSLSRLSEQHRDEFIRQMRELREMGRSPKTIADQISAFNLVAEYAGKRELWISASRYGLSRPAERYVDRSVSAEAHDAFCEWLKRQYRRTGDIRYEALRHSVELQKAFGLSPSESFCIKVTKKDISKGFLRINRHDDSRAGKSRSIPIWNENQAKVFTEAREFAERKGWFSLIPPESTKKEHLSFVHKAVRQFRREVKRYSYYHLFGERHAFAQEYMLHLLEQRGKECGKPVKGKSLREIKWKLMEALGLSRIEQTRRYMAF